MEKKCIISKLNLIKNEISRAFSDESESVNGINVGSIITDIEREIREKEEILEKEVSNNQTLNDKLKQSEEYFENIYKNIDAAIFVIDVDRLNGEFRYAGANPAYERVIGVNEKEVLGKMAEEIFTKEISEGFNRNYNNCIEVKSMIEYEESLNIKGKNTWWHTKLIPVKDSFGNINRIIGTSYDITPIKNAENQAKANEEFISILIDTIPNPVFYKNIDGNYIGCNTAFERIVEVERENIYGKKCENIFTKEISEITEYKDEELIVSGKKLKYEIKHKRKDGEWKNYMITKAPYFDVKGKINGIVGVISDITDLKKMQEILKELSVNDELTGVYNKRGIREMGEKSFREAQREGSLISIIMIDIDYFKKYNDYYGHQAGDRCLIAVADTIKEACKRPLDIVGRYGGEEFIVILSDTDYEGSCIVAERIRQSVFNLKIAHEESETEKYISVSAGLYSGIPTEKDRIEIFIEKADEKLYEAKKYGRNRVEK